MNLKRVLPVLVVLTMTGALLLARTKETVPSGTQMVTAAEKFLAALDEKQRAQATFNYNDKERLNWHFIPRERKGVPLRDLEGPALAAAQGLIASGLSKTGYEQTLNIMSLEEILYLLEGGDRATRRERRDPKKYYLTVFGTPSTSGTWGWRLEGHHISLNYSIKDGKVVSSTPEFFGANPGLVDAGPKRSIRVLAAEEDIARQILKLSDPTQKKAIWLDTKAPDDLRGGNVVQPEKTAAVGLAAEKMSADQQKLLRDLLAEYLRNMPEDVAEGRRSQIEAAGFEKIHFAWWGDEERNQRHYYRVQGPTFLIEYNNTQNDANHVHSYWRDLAGDFNIPLKKAAP